ncbi:hypothetical protein ACIRYZ_33885 [Kitasatospora sp. NPDC101155]|uniref:hypothetical protein n=1 Tax=Kitasatospora sp. NPDC101155 TaxID=3364097 RepID=UPI0037F1F7BF
MLHVHTERPRPVSRHTAAWVRPLHAADEARLDRFARRATASTQRAVGPHWITETWGGHRAFAASGVEAAGFRPVRQEVVYWAGPALPR